MILIILLHALWAASVTVSKILLAVTPPIFLTAIRMTIAGTILLLYHYFYDSTIKQLKRQDFWLFAQVAFFGIFLTYNLRHWALKDGMPAAKAMFLYNSAPFISALYSYFMFNERMSRQKWIGLLIGCIGMIPILITSTPAEAALGELFGISWYELAILASAAAHSYSWIVMRKLVRDKNYSPAIVNGICMLGGGIFALGNSLLMEQWQPIENLGSFVLLLAFVIIVSNIICHNLYGHLLRTYTATFLSFTHFMGPPYAALYGWLLFKNPITWHYYVSSVVMFLGLYFFYKQELQDDIVVATDSQEL